MQVESCAASCEEIAMLLRLPFIAAGLAATLAAATPAAAQFYKDKTLTLLVNYGVGGNADTEARVYQRHLRKYIAGEPTLIIRNAPGAGGAAAMNQLGLGIGTKPDGLTAGYFTTSATQSLVDDPALKVKLYDFCGARLERRLCAQGHRAGRAHAGCRHRQGQEHLRRRLRARNLARHAVAHGA
jgi:hypothetical protein